MSNVTQHLLYTITHIQNFLNAAQTPLSNNDNILTSFLYKKIGFQHFLITEVNIFVSASVTQ